VGLVTLDQMKAKQENLVKEREKQLALKHQSIQLKEIEEKRQQKERQKRQVLAFNSVLTKNITLIHLYFVSIIDSNAFLSF
jgi:hypothetical protein